MYRQQGFMPVMFTLTFNYIKLFIVMFISHVYTWVIKEPLHFLRCHDRRVVYTLKPNLTTKTAGTL